MLFIYLIELVFQRRYLKKFAYGNAVTQDLWDCFSEISGQDIGANMSTWTKQMGFPLVNTKQTVNSSFRTLKLSQARYLADGGKDKTNYLWQTPFTVSLASSPDEPVFCGVLTSQSAEYKLDNVKPSDWLKVNSGFANFFRVY